MDMPPSGWYPDPYGVPSLLRWWDGSAWTEHTQQFEGSGQPPNTGGPAEPSRGPVTSLDLPPATSLDLPPVTALDLPAAPPPSQAGPADTAFDLPAIGGSFEPPGNATRIYSPDDFGGYARAQRERQIRRRWIMGILAAGTAVVMAIVAVAVLKLGSQPAANQPVALRSTPSGRHTSAAPSPTASPTPSPTPSVSLVSDTSSGLAYTKLSSPWQAQCPSGLNQQQFTWTAGESAVAGQVNLNGQQTSWYGNACSTTLPQQYSYNGVQDLASTASQVANTVENTYYNGLSHTTTQQLSQPLQVSGHAAWEITYLVSYTDTSGQGLAWSSEQGAVVVVDRGSGAPAVFYVSVPSNLGEQNAASLVSSLQLSSASASPSATASASASAASGSPGDGNGNGNGGGDGQNP